jgi:hypothetical protein
VEARTTLISTHCGCDDDKCGNREDDGGDDVSNVGGSCGGDGGSSRYGACAVGGVVVEVSVFVSNFMSAMIPNDQNI